MLERWQTFFFYNFGTSVTYIVGPQFIPLRYTVNFFKGFSFLWILYLIYFFQNRTPVMCLYFCLHGSYGLLWVLKDIYFPDIRALKKATLGSHILLCVLLFGYWCIPVPLAMGYGTVNPSIGWIVSLVVMYLTGLVLMLGSDYQKYCTLKKRKGLITTLFFKLSRNPNYLG